MQIESLESAEAPLPRPRARHRGVLLLTALLFAFGLNVSVSFYLVLAGTFLVVLTFAYAYANHVLGRLTCGRKIYHGAFEGEQVRVRVDIGNHGKLPVFLPEVCDHFTPDQTSLKEVLAPIRLDPGKRCSRPYAGTCFRRRGTYKLGPMAVRVGDPLGLFELEKPVEVPMDYFVYPGTFAVPRYPLAGHKVVFTTGYDAVPRSGQSQLYMGTREYRAGDEVRTIDWNATARFGKMVVKEFEADVDPEVTIFLDLDRKHAQGMGQRSTLETGVKIAASIALSCLGSRAFFQFVALGSRYHYLPFGSGDQHLIRMLDLLVHVKQDGAGSFGDFLVFTRDLVKQNSTAFLIFTSNEIEPDKLAPVLAHYRSRNARVYAVVLDDASFIQWKQHLDLDTLLEMRNQAIAYLQGEGCTVIPVDAEKDIEEEFRAAMA